MNFIIEYGSKFLSSVILMGAIVYSWHKLLNKKVNFKSIKLILTISSLGIISIVNHYIMNPYIKIISINIVLIIGFSILFKETIQKCIIIPIFCQLIIMLGETLLALFIAIGLKMNAELLLNSFLVSFLINALEALFLIIAIQFKFIIKLYNKILNFTDRIKRYELLFLCLIIIVALSVFPITIYYETKFEYLLIFYSSMIICCCLIVFSLIKTQNKYLSVNDKYNVAIKSLKDYESMMTKYRIANHENKNLLLTIRAMILNNEADIPKYIDSIVEENYADDEKLLFKMSVIPSGGLRATIYSEILKIKENNINYDLNIDKNLSTIDFIEIEEKAIIDICKIVGVLIDNAVDEVKRIRSKNISIELFLMDNLLNIKVANKFKEKIELDKIFNEGYTTKGKNHGYGLSLVKKIIDNNKTFRIRTEINNKIFIQTLMVELNQKVK